MERYECLQSEVLPEVTDEDAKAALVDSRLDAAMPHKTIKTTSFDKERLSQALVSLIRLGRRQPSGQL